MSREHNKDDNNKLFNDNTTLNYKNHNGFFDKFYEIRWDLIFSMTNSLNDYSQLKYTYNSLNAFIRWTSSQLKRGNADFNKINKDKKDIAKLIAAKQNLTALSKIEDLFDYISEIHEKIELIPRINVNEQENEKFWRDEDNKAMKEVKKAFFDVLMVE